MSPFALTRRLQSHAILIMIVVLIATLTLLSGSLHSAQNLLNIHNRNAPLAIMAAAMTLVIIAGGVTFRPDRSLLWALLSRPRLP